MKIQPLLKALAFLAIPAAIGAVPTVANVAFLQTGSNVNITYDLASPNGACTVEVQVSTDGGVTFPVVASGATGNVGSGVAPGTGLSVAWNPTTQFPSQVQSNVVLRVAAQDSLGSLTVTNHGFEANPQSAGALQITTPTGWSAYNGGNLNGSGNVIGWGNLNGTGHYTSTPEGSNIGLCFLSGSPEGEAGLEQTLAATLEANALYTLVVEVGNIDQGTANFGYFDLRGFPGYRVNLLAGTTPIATDNNSLNGTIPDGQWRTSTIRAATGAAPAEAGQALTVRLVNLDAPPVGEELAREVNFDNVRLTAAGIGSSSVGTIDTTSASVGDVWLLLAE